MWCARQVALLPSGCQPWNRDVCAASEDWFAYCATLAIYLYQMDQHHYEFKLRAIMSEHKRTITAISWSPHCPEVFASASMDGLLIIWNVIERKVVSRLKLIEDTPSFLSWCPDCSDTVTFTSPSGPLYLWTVTEIESNVVPHHEAHNFLSEVCLFRWHPQNNGRVVFGHSDGSISIFQPGRKSQKHMLRPEALEGTDEEDPVTALEWDPLSAAYLLVANQGNGLRLLDVDSLTCITCFSLSSIVMTVRCLAWLTTAPGMFITGDSQVGILRVWNVSRPSPLENLKLKKTGFHTLGVFLSPPRNKYQRPKSPCGNRYTSSSSSKSHAVRLAQGHVICCFKDAGVGLYDLGTRKWDFFQDMGHVETIFDCEFKPDNPNLLATASFDGTIKVWDINDMAATAMSPGNEGVIYSLSWAPGDLNCIAGSTSCNGAFIWDINKGTIRIRFNEHGKNRIFSIAWNKNDPKRIATGSADGFCIIHSIEGKVLQRYRHPAAVYGCDWSHTSSNMIATGCEDGNVRVYYLAAGSDQPLKVFKGHTAKVFNVRWSPLREGIFCSGSDDNTVRIWDYTKAACIITLCGHTGPVRGLVWNTEVPYLLVSGSWDYSIRIWDTRSGVCLDIVQVHGADVYGVTCHPRRPFTMASCSRDSTVRLWTLTPLVAPLTLGLLAQRPWEEIIGRLDEAMAPCSPPLLCGNISKDIKQEIEKLGEDVQAKKLCLFSEFFFPLGGSKNLCDLVAVLRDQEESLLPHDYSRGIVHARHMVKIKMSEAQRLTSTKMHKLGCSIGAPSKEDQLRAAAAIHLRLGQLQRYCELMVELGEWDKALCVAPGVSMRYWKKLMQRRATQLLDEGSDEAIPYCIATGDLTSVVEFFSARGQLADALLVTQATCEGNVQAPIHNHSGSTPPGRPSLGKDNAKLLVQVSTDMAECYLQDGRAIVSACCRLAVDDIEMAMATLVRGNELELAVMVGLVLGDQAAPLTHYSLQLLARRAQALGHWYLAVDLLKQMPKNDMAMVKLCSSTQLCNEELDVLHQKCNLPSLEECALLAQSLHEQGDVLQTVRYTLLSPAPETALEMGLAFVKDVMSRKDWKLQDVLSVLDMLGSIRTKVLLLPQFSKQKNELLILCGYAGAMLAIRRRYITIVAALYEYTSQLLRWRDVTVPLVVEELALELDAWQSCQGEDVHSSDAQLVLYETLMERVGHEPIRSMVGQDYVTASHLPSHSEVYTSCLNGAMIQGPAVLLEDGKSAIPVNDALMWSKVNPFSPLGTGLHLLPL